MLVSRSISLPRPALAAWARGEFPVGGERRPLFPEPGGFPRLCTPRRRCAPPLRQVRFPRRLPNLRSSKPCSQPAGPGQLPHSEGERRLLLHLQLSVNRGMQARTQPVHREGSSCRKGGARPRAQGRCLLPPVGAGKPHSSGHIRQRAQRISIL